MSKKKKIIIVTFSTITLILLSLLLGGYFYVTNMLDKIEKVDINKENLGINESIDKTLSDKYGNIQNIALFGIDNVDGLVGRSDSIMILTIDRVKKTTKITSIMRDSYVNIPGKEKKDKINHAYAFGGPELAIRTLNENFDLNIKDFITVNFSSLPKIIDLIGGLEIEIDEEELKYINNYIRNINAKNGTNDLQLTSTGMQHLNGTQSMAYCRIRYTAGGDYKRTERHREVLGAIFKKVQGISISKYPKLLDNVLPMVKSNFSSNDILAIGGDLVKIGGELEEERFPKDGQCKGEKIDGTYYLTFNEVATKKQMHDWIFEGKR